MKTWEKFQSLIIKAAQKELKPIFEKNSKDFKELGKVLWNRLFNTGGPIKIKRDLTKEEQFFGKIFYGFLEINSSIQTLKDIEIYVGNFPYRQKKITKPRHLRYHIENYFNEIYILKERLLSYLTVIGRCYRKDKRHGEILKKTRPVFKIVHEALEGIIKTRGKHVHQSRFHDDDLDRLETMELFVSGKPDKFSEVLAGYYKFTYQAIRNKWKKSILKNNNEILKELLNIYSDIIFDIIFDEQREKLIFPKMST